MGFTQEELERDFKEHLAGVDLSEVKGWYNGYNFMGERVYNPFDILLFVDNDQQYRNYWWQTGQPKFFIDLLKQNEYYLPELQ